MGGKYSVLKTDQFDPNKTLDKRIMNICVKKKTLSDEFDAVTNIQQLTNLITKHIHTFVQHVFDEIRRLSNETATTSETNDDDDGDMYAEEIISFAWICKRALQYYFVRVHALEVSASQLCCDAPIRSILIGCSDMPTSNSNTEKQEKEATSFSSSSSSNTRLFQSAVFYSSFVNLDDRLNDKTTPFLKRAQLANEVLQATLSFHSFAETFASAICRYTTTMKHLPAPLVIKNTTIEHVMLATMVQLTNYIKIFERYRFELSVNIRDHTGIALCEQDKYVIVSNDSFYHMCRNILQTNCAHVVFWPILDMFVRTHNSISSNSLDAFKFGPLIMTSYSICHAKQDAIERSYEWLHMSPWMKTYVRNVIENIRAKQIFAARVDLGHHKYIIPIVDKQIDYSTFHMETNTSGTTTETTSPTTSTAGTSVPTFLCLCQQIQAAMNVMLWEPKTIASMTLKENLECVETWLGRHPEQLTTHKTIPLDGDMEMFYFLNNLFNPDKLPHLENYPRIILYSMYRFMLQPNRMWHGTFRMKNINVAIQVMENLGFLGLTFSVPACFIEFISKTNLSVEERTRWDCLRALWKEYQMLTRVMKTCSSVCKDHANNDSCSSDSSGGDILMVLECIVCRQSEVLLVEELMVNPPPKAFPQLDEYESVKHWAKKLHLFFDFFD